MRKPGAHEEEFEKSLIESIVTENEFSPFFDKGYWKEWVTKKNKSLAFDSKDRFNIVDLFSGCGGMTLGVSEAASLNQLQLSVALAADVLPAAAAAYKANFKEITRNFFSEDISHIFPAKGIKENEIDFKERYGEIDLLVAGPPCQGHSNLNNSTRRTDPRNQLYLSAITAIEALRPIAAIVENVPAVIHDKTGVTQSSHQRLIKAGYFVEELVLHMEQLGLPQKRKRHLLVARLKKGNPIEPMLEKYKSPPPGLKDFIGDIKKEWKIKNSIYATASKMTKENQVRTTILFEKKIYDLPDKNRPACHRDKPHSYKSAYGRLSWSAPAQTITSGFGSMGQGRYVHPSEHRTITPHEAARIQGFPDFFDFSSISKRTQLQEIIANAVPPPAIAIIVQLLINDQAFKKEEDGNKKN